MKNLQSVSIVAAFPIGIVMVLIILSFLKDAKECMDCTFIEEAGRHDKEQYDLQ